MTKEQELEQVWSELAAWIESLPEGERKRYQRALAIFAHDLRSAVGIIYSAEALLRRGAKPDDIELLDIIRESSKRAMRLLTGFAQPIDSEVTRPVSRPSGMETDES